MLILVASECIVFYIGNHTRLLVILQDEFEHTMFFRMFSSQVVMTRLDNTIMQRETFGNVEFASVVQETIVFLSFNLNRSFFRSLD